MQKVLVFIRKMKTFLCIGWQTKVLAIQIFCLCGIVRSWILMRSFKKIQPYLGEHNTESNQEEARENYKKAKHISWLVESVSRYTPWESKCLVQAIVAQYVLARQKIPTTLYLGVKKGEQGEIKAHAWLRCGQMIVTGQRAMVGYKEVSKFANQARMNRLDRKGG